MGDRTFPRQLKEVKSVGPSPSDLQWIQDNPDYFGSLENMNMQESKSGSTSDQLQAATGYVIGVTSSIFAEHILSHPFIVLRRQCQVHHNGVWYHNTPFTLVTVLVQLQRHQGMSSSWKGIVSVLMSKGILMVNETVISELTPLPKEVTRHSSPRKHLEHLLLKGLAYILATPFLATSFIETIQADISSDKPGPIDFIKEGVGRVMGWGMPQTTRLLPVYTLILPTAMMGVSQYVIVQVARATMLSSFKQREQEMRDKSTSVDGKEQEESLYNKYFPEMMANFAGNLLADVLLFPLETVLHRLYAQGTRTIIDNLDTGVDVIPISTNYQGFFDCFRSILVEEGISGLYRGFGALILQYALQACLLKFSKYMFEKVSKELNSPNSMPPAPTSMPPTTPVKQRSADRLNQPRHPEVAGQQQQRAQQPQTSYMEQAYRNQRR
ncbi:mitochondrial outer membrane protein SLC25A46-like [Saccostrea echinata]|uniref:mitochondrial outer membrane protein SLC25A46-like n=1 Tax=Saccostrea echinata TaxID=191078 RepID=UPI002A7F36AC|nr:mitochondrial outer membrane protein SLC25A46-like [Saccostrea echinata]